MLKLSTPKTTQKTTINLDGPEGNPVVLLALYIPVKKAIQSDSNKPPIPARYLSFSVQTGGQQIRYPATAVTVSVSRNQAVVGHPKPAFGSLQEWWT